MTLKRKFVTPTTATTTTPKLKQARTRLDVSHIPNTKELPNVIEPIPTPSNHFKICSFNVAGWHAANKKGFNKYLAGENADIVCIQETKLNIEQANALNSLICSFKQTYPYQYFHCCTVKKGYSGTLILSKIKPNNVTYGFPKQYKMEDNEGRVITLEFPGIFFTAAYVMNAGQDLKRLNEKLQFTDTYRQYIKDLDTLKPVVWCGDLNVAHKEIDLARPETNSGTPGFTPEERADFTNTLTTLSMVDVWRNQNPAPFQKFTYFSYRSMCRIKRIGWRLDYFVVSARILDMVGDCVIRDDCYGMSDHVPVIMSVDKSMFSTE